MKNPGDKFFKSMKSYLASHYGPDFSTRVLDLARPRFEELCLENKGESEALKAHTHKRIYPSIAVFEAVYQVTGDRGEAVEVIRDYFSSYTESVMVWMRRVFRLPGLYRAYPAMFSANLKSRYSQEAGFDFNIKEDSSQVFAFDMVKCPYNDITTKYGCNDICPAFCETDDISAGTLHEKIIWGRTQTLARADYCNFDVRIRD